LDDPFSAVAVTGAVDVTVTHGATRSISAFVASSDRAELQKGTLQACVLHRSNRSYVTFSCGVAGSISEAARFFGNLEMGFGFEHAGRGSQAGC
jgi:hypothetical protein